MAIDSAEKRRSAAHVGSRRGPGVTPNVLKDAEWRQQAGWGYSGIAAQLIVFAPTILAAGTWSKTSVADGTWAKAGVSNGVLGKTGVSDGTWEKD